MSLSKQHRNVRSERERKLRSRIDLEVTADSYAETFGSVLERKYGAPKEITRKFGFNLLTSRNLLRRKNGPSGLSLVRLIREDDDALYSLLELAGRHDAVNKIKALTSVDDALAALNRLKAASK